MKIFTRQRVGLRPPKQAYSSRGPLRHVSWHHGGPVGGYRWTFKSASETWRQFQAFHQVQRGWNDVAYTAGIDARGRLYEGRPATAITASVENHNTGQIAFVFLQDGRHYKLTRLQRRTLRILMEKGCPELNIPPLKHFKNLAHNEYAGHESNDCPGVHIKRHLIWRRNQY